MAARIVELFGYDREDSSAAAVASRKKERCPFIGTDCAKLIGRGSDQIKSGVCSLAQPGGRPVVVCPNRFYADNYGILRHIAEMAFGGSVQLIHPANLNTVELNGKHIAVFGKRWGKELPLPKKRGKGNYYLDWVLVRIGPGKVLADFTAVEVQSVDTTGNYRADRVALLAGGKASPPTDAGVNWENVNKRILPQIILKGHVLRRERLCTQGLFFVCPTGVYEKIKERLGDSMMEYPRQPGALTFLAYGLDDVPPGALRTLILEEQFTTTVDQVAMAFASPPNLPDQGVYMNAILRALK